MSGRPGPGRSRVIEYERHGIDGLYLGRSTSAVDDRGSFARVFDVAALQAADRLE